MAISIKRTNLYASLAVILFLELTFFNKFRIFGVRPELLMTAAIFFGFHFGVSYGAEAGLASGIIKDIFSISPFGINTVSFLLIGAAAGFLKDKVFKENAITQFAFSFLSVCVSSAAVFIYLTETASSGVGGAFWKTCLCKGIYTGFLAPITFFILNAAFKPKNLQDL
ncbi:MAG: rod shape-determining protein MreD [Candidatus Omnitrophica bacterium]|nr:rod shape-determining protein MreD [Candidatus Omnitrophota bacterium]